MNKSDKREVSQDDIRQFLDVITDKAMSGDAAKEHGSDVSITRGLVLPRDAHSQILTIERHFNQPLRASVLQMEQEVSGDILTRTDEIKQVRDHLSIACHEITIAAFDEPYQTSGGIKSEAERKVTEPELAELNTLVSGSYPEPVLRGMRIHAL